MNWLNYLAEINLKSSIQENSRPGGRQFLPWDKIESIGLVISNSTSLNKSKVDRFIDETRKYVEVFYIEINSKTPSYGDWHCFSKKDSSLLKLPRKNSLKNIEAKEFDLVINTAGETEFYAAAITSVLSAKMKCAGSEKIRGTDLIISKNDAFSVDVYLREVVKYLKMIRI